jgi:DNA-binding protein HU-beta
LDHGQFQQSSKRDGRNPQTGKTIQIAAKNVVKFKAGAELEGAVN